MKNKDYVTIKAETPVGAATVGFFVSRYAWDDDVKKKAKRLIPGLLEASIIARRPAIRVKGPR